MGAEWLITQGGLHGFIGMGGEGKNVTLICMVSWEKVIWGGHYRQYTRFENRTIGGANGSHKAIKKFDDFAIRYPRGNIGTRARTHALIHTPALRKGLKIGIARRATNDDGTTNWTSSAICVRIGPTPPHPHGNRVSSFHGFHDPWGLHVFWTYICTYVYSNLGALAQDRAALGGGGA